MKLIEKQQLIENTATRTNNGKGGKNSKQRHTLSIASKREKKNFHAIERINGNNKNMFL